MKKQLLQTLAALILLPTFAFAGPSEGGGGDAVLRDGKYMPRDFLKGGDMQLVSDNMAFLREIPGFESFLNEVAQAHAGLALKVLEQLATAKLWLTNEPIPLLPEAVTSVVGPKADLQIAIRENYDIIISLSAFHQIDRDYQKFVLFHEALHGLISGTGPIHHTYVRSIVRELYENQGKINKTNLDAILRQSQANVLETTLEEDFVLHALLAGTRQEPLACAAYGFWSMAGLDTESASYYSRYRGKFEEIVGRWRNFSGCDQNSFFDFIGKTSPALSQLILTKRFSPSYFTKVNKPSSWFPSASEKEFFEKECRQFSTSEALAVLDKESQYVESIIKIIEEASGEIQEINSRELSPQVAFLKMVARTDLITNNQPGRSFLESFLNSATKIKSMKEEYSKMAAEIREHKAIYEENVKVCQ